MDGTIDGVIRFSARQVTGQQRRTFLALVCKQLCDGLVGDAKPSLVGFWNKVDKASKNIPLFATALFEAKFAILSLPSIFD
jgi:hypothetical protein